MSNTHAAIDAYSSMSADRPTHSTDQLLAVLSNRLHALEDSAQIYTNRANSTHDQVEKLHKQLERIRADAEKTKKIVSFIDESAALGMQKRLEKKYVEMSNQYRSLFMRVMISNEVAIHALANGMPEIARVMLIKFNEHDDWWRGKADLTIEQWITLLHGEIGLIDKGE